MSYWQGKAILHAHAFPARSAASFLRVLAALLVSACVHPLHAFAQPAENSWILTTADFANRRVRLVEWNRDAGRILEADGQSGELHMQQLVRLERQGAAAAAPSGEAPFVLHMRSGDRLQGNPLRLNDTSLVMQTALFGEVEVPLDQLLALESSQAGGGAAWRLPSPAADEIVLANGDQMRGYVAAIEGENWTFADERGNETPLTAAAIRQVRFADPGAPAAAAQGVWRVRFVDGSLLTLESVSFSDGEFTLSYRGREAKQPETGVVWLEPVEGPVRWLADLPVAEAEHTPYFGASFPGIAEAQSAEAGGRGFTVRSRSRLSFDIPNGYSRFRTRYGVDRNMVQGAVDIRILLDGKVAHERKGFTAADLSEPVDIRLDGAKRITLEVDYGPGLDVQDVVHWIDPALVKD